MLKNICSIFVILYWQSLPEALGELFSSPSCMCIRLLFESLVERFKGFVEPLACNNSRIKEIIPSCFDIDIWLF